MRNKVIGVVAVLLILGLITSHRLEPELKVYPLAMGFDLSENGYEVYYDIPNLSTYTGEGKPMEQEERIWHFTGSGNRDIEASIAQSKKETPDMGHVQAILFGENLLNEQEKYGEVLESFANEPLLGSGSYVFFCRDMEGVMQVSAEKTDSLGEYLVDLTDKSPEQRPILLQDLYNAYYNKEPLPKMMEVKVEEGNLVVLEVRNL